MSVRKRTWKSPSGEMKEAWVVDQHGDDPLADLCPRQRELVEGTLQTYPELSVEKAIEILRYFGGL